MSNVIGTVSIGGTSPLADGITQTTRDNAIVGIQDKTNDVMFVAGVMGVSVTRLDDPTTQSWAVEVRSNIGGLNQVIAGVTAIGTTTAVLIPILQGTTQSVSGHIGIPRPTTVDIVGSSTAVGLTFGCIVTMNLYNPS